LAGISQRGTAAILQPASRLHCTPEVRSGSIVCITAVQHWGPLRPSQQTLRERSRTTLRGSIHELARVRFCPVGYSSGWIDYRESVALQSPQLVLRLDCFQFCQHLWRSENTRRYPIDRPLRGNEFALCGGVGETLTHGGCAARLIEADMSHDIICVPEVYKDEPAFCHALPRPDRNSGITVLTSAA
jgi:hypothetical protein